MQSGCYKYKYISQCFVLVEIILEWSVSNYKLSSVLKF